MWRGEAAIHDRGGDPADDRAVVGGGGVPAGVARRRTRSGDGRSAGDAVRPGDLYRCALRMAARRGTPGMDGRGVLFRVGSFGGPSEPQERPATGLAGAESGLDAIAGDG